MKKRVKYYFLKKIFAFFFILLLFEYDNITNCQKIEDIRIMCMGNSITRGKYGFTYRQFLRPQIDSMNIIDSLNFVGSNIQPPDDILSFDSSWSSYPEPYNLLEGDIEHEGYGGYKIQDLIDLSVSDIIRDHDPDIILMMVGTNDIPGNYEGSQQRLKILIDSVFVSPFNPFLLVSTIPPRLDSRGNELLEAILYNNDIRSLIDDLRSRNHPVNYVDARSLMDESSIHKDGIHPNEKGHKEISQAFLSEIQTLIQKPSVPYNVTIRHHNSNQINLIWEDSAYFSEGFLIERSSDLENNFSILDTVKNFTLNYIDSTVTSYATYHYRLKTINRFNHSDYSDTVSLKIASEINIDNLERGISFKVFPNPTHGIIRVERNPTFKKNGNLDIIDINGRIRRTYKIQENMIINLSDITPGIYFVVFNDSGERIRILIER